MLIWWGDWKATHQWRIWHSTIKTFLHCFINNDYKPMSTNQKLFYLVHCFGRVVDMKTDSTPPPSHIIYFTASCSLILPDHKNKSTRTASAVKWHPEEILFKGVACWDRSAVHSTSIGLHICLCMMSPKIFPACRNFFTLIPELVIIKAHRSVIRVCLCSAYSVCSCHGR